MANIYGIDVSEHNGALDFAKIKASGVRFVIIRTGYGVSHQDDQFENNIKGALAQGLPVGVYHFSYALTESGAEQEAEFCKSILAPYKEQITLPVFYDFEYDTVRYAKDQGVTLGKPQFNAHAVAFLENIKQAGYTPGIYYNLDYKRNMVNDGMVGDYVQWYAQYASSATWTGYDLWQYSSTHTITGITGNFDINVADESFLTWFTAPSNTFSDVPADTWYADAVHYCASRGIMQGTGSGKFQPDLSLTRAEAASIAARLHRILSSS